MYIQLQLMWRAMLDGMCDNGHSDLFAKPQTHVSGRVTRIQNSRQPAFITCSSVTCVYSYACSVRIMSICVYVMWFLMHVIYLYVVCIYNNIVSGSISIFPIVGSRLCNITRYIAQTLLFVCYII